MENEDTRAIVCELCGSNELIKDGDVFVCQHCGTKYATEEARKHLVEVNVTIDEPVRVQGVATVDNLLRRADDFERRGDLERAAEYYDRVLDIDIDNGEANRGIARVRRQSRHAAASSPAKAKGPNPAKTEGPNLIIDFTKAHSGSMVGIFIDGRKRGNVWGGTTESYTLATGTHLVGVNGGARRCRHPLEITVREGVTYRLVARWKGLSMQFQVVEE